VVGAELLVQYRVGVRVREAGRSFAPGAADQVEAQVARLVRGEIGRASCRERVFFVV
jgi:hypothetical protein